MELPRRLAHKQQLPQQLPAGDVLLVLHLVHQPRRRVFHLFDARRGDVETGGFAAAAMRRAEHLESIFRLSQTGHELDHLNVGLHLPRDGGDDLLADGGEEAEKSEIARGLRHLDVGGDGRQEASVQLAEMALDDTAEDGNLVRRGLLLRELWLGVLTLIGVLAGDDLLHRLLHEDLLHRLLDYQVEELRRAVDAVRDDVVVGLVVVDSGASRTKARGARLHTLGDAERTTATRDACAGGGRGDSSGGGSRRRARPRTRRSDRRRSNRRGGHHPHDVMTRAMPNVRSHARRPCTPGGDGSARGARSVVVFAAPDACLGAADRGLAFARQQLPMEITGLTHHYRSTSFRSFEHTRLSTSRVNHAFHEMT